MHNQDSQNVEATREWVDLKRKTSVRVGVLDDGRCVLVLESDRQALSMREKADGEYESHKVFGDPGEAQTPYLVRRVRAGSRAALSLDVAAEPERGSGRRGVDEVVQPAHSIAQSDDGSRRFHPRLDLSKPFARDARARRVGQHAGIALEEPHDVEPIEVAFQRQLHKLRA